MSKLLPLSKIMGELNRDLTMTIDAPTAIRTLAGIKPELKSLIMLHYDPRLKWKLPSGNPPFTPLAMVENEGMLYRLINKKYFRYFIDGNEPAIAPAKLQKMFVDTLQSVHPDDAEMLIGIKDGKNLWPAITYDLIKAAFVVETSAWGNATRVKDAKPSVAKRIADSNKNKKIVLSVTDPVSFDDPVEVPLAMITSPADIIGVDPEDLHVVINDTTPGPSEIRKPIQKKKPVVVEQTVAPTNTRKKAATKTKKPVQTKRKVSKK